MNQQQPSTQTPVNKMNIGVLILPIFYSEQSTEKVITKGLNSSARGRKFRAKQKEQFSALLKYVGELKCQVQDLHYQRELLKFAHFDHLCLQVVQQYHAISSQVASRIGQLGNEAALSQRVNFARNVLHPDIVMYDGPVVLKGLKAISSRSAKVQSLFAHVEHIPGPTEVVATAPNVTILAHSKMKVRFSRDTLIALFPHVLCDIHYTQELIGLEVVIDVKSRNHFGKDGKIVVVEKDTNIITGLVAALGSVEDALGLIDGHITPSNYIESCIGNNGSN